MTVNLGRIIFALILMFHMTSAWADVKKPFAYDAKGRRDPFIPWQGHDTQSDRGSQDFRVEGIISDPGGSLAVINGVVLKEGDTAGAYKISKIEKTRVLITKKDEKIWLPFKTGDES